MDPNGTEQKRSPLLDLVTLGTEFGKLVYESGKREPEAWAEEMLRLDEALRPLLKNIYTLLLAAERPAGTKEGQPAPEDDGMESTPPNEPERGETLVDDGLRTEDTTTSIGELLNRQQLSVRAFNVCRNAGLLTLGDIKHYSETHGTFKHLKSCGVTTSFLLCRLAVNETPARNPEASSATPEPPIAHSNPGQLIRTFNKAFSTLRPEAQEHLRSVVPNLKPDLVYAYLVGLGRHIPPSDTGRKGVAVELRHLRRRLIAANKMDKALPGARRTKTTHTRPQKEQQTALGSAGERLIELLREHQQPLHIQSIARKLGLDDQASRDALWETILSGKHDPAAHVGEGFVGLYWRTYSTLPPAPKPLHDSLYRKPIWEYFTGLPIKELHTYLLGCTDLGEGHLITAIYRKMHEKGYYLDTRACLRSGPVE